MKKKINNDKHYKNYYSTNISSIVNKRYKILVIILSIFFIFLIISLFYIQIIQGNEYKYKLSLINEVVIDGSSPARGRIYDRNGNIIVDNQAVKTIYYKKKIGVTKKEEVSLAYKAAELLEVDFKKLNDFDLRNFWVINNSISARNKVTDEEWTLYEERKLSLDDIEKIKRDRVTKKELEEYKDIDKEAAYIYYLMNKGYSYQEKVIKDENVTDKEYALVASNKDELKGFINKLDWKRHYIYGDTMRSILGNVSTSSNGIPYENKDSYLALGYSLNDRVGISYLEYQYESILKGTKNKYILGSNGEYILKEEGSRGNDIVLTIDIKLQKEIEKIVTDELIKAKIKDKHTKYFDRAFVIVSNPKTGEILAIVGKIIKKEDGKWKVYDYSNGTISESITPGSSVKAASHMVGYMTGNLKIGEYRNDACIKIAATPLKCSYTRYGNINDVQALKYSSNTYQFHTAIKVGKGKYRYNGPLKLNEKAFDTYRDIFSQFGLGVKTGIDLPNEQLGYTGTGKQPGLLLDYSIGQYDNYTPIQMSQYINTVANDGMRMKPFLLKEVYSPTKDGLTSLIYTNSPIMLNQIKADKKYFSRIKKGLQEVIKSGTGYGFIDNKYKAAGKTGTSESFIDTNNDGKIDKETLSTSLVAYAPYDNPKVTFTVITPNIGTGNISFNQISTINKRISRKISKKYFEIYK